MQRRVAKPFINPIHINTHSNQRSTHACSTHPCCITQRMPPIPSRIRAKLDQCCHNFITVPTHDRILDTPPPTPHRPIQIHASRTNPSSHHCHTPSLNTNPNKRNPSSTLSVSNNFSCNLIQSHVVHSITSSSPCNHRTKSLAQRRMPSTHRTISCCVTIFVHDANIGTKPNKHLTHSCVPMQRRTVQRCAEKLALRVHIDASANEHTAHPNAPS
jgi:hypothetical protein